MRRLTLICLALIVAMLVAGTASAQLRLTGTQMLMLEYDGRELSGIGTLVVDLALGPRWHATYIHDRAWLPGGRHQVHDVSVTRVLALDRTATLGWRVKVPESGEGHGTGYVWLSAPSK